MAKPRKAKRRRGKDGGNQERPAREFSDENFRQHFAEIVEHYRAKKQTLERWRRLFRHRQLAGLMARFVKNCFTQAYAQRVYRQVLDGVDGAPDPADLPYACIYDPAHLERVFRHPLGGPGANAHVFDPWTGRWQGKWTSSSGNRPPGDPAGPNPSDQFHIWDETVQAGDVWVQPVTQSDDELVDNDNIDQQVQQNGADLAINTFDNDCGIAGWVSKRQGGAGDEYPHLGFRVAPGVLIWINQRHDRHCNALDEHFSIYFEWVDESGHYGILGKRFMLTGQGPRELRPSEGAYANEHHGSVYRRPQ